MEFSEGYIFEKKTKKIVENENDYKFLNWENGKIVAIIVPITCEGTKGNIWWKEGEGELAEEKKSQRKTVVTEKDLQAIVEPESSPVLSEGKSGPHKIQGIGAGFIPKVLNTSVYDEVIKVTNESAFEYSKIFAREEGILVGISAGAALFAAVKLAKRPENENKNIVVLLPDSGDRYYSTPLFVEK